MKGENNLSLLVRRTIAAKPETLFEAWTQPALLMKWWGPKNVSCIAAEIDLSIGGTFKITNRLPDHSIVIIQGVFLHIQKPNKLIYSWNTGNSSIADEKVTVWFKGKDDGTEVVISHEKISSGALHQSHKSGWQGCLVGLDKFVKNAANR